MKTLRALLIAGTVAVGGATAPAAFAGAHFTSPSGNIDCLVHAEAGGTASCWVERAAWRSTVRKPASCPLAWMPTEVSLTGRRVSVGVCRGDIGPMCQPGGCRVLGYGKSIVTNGIRCTSTTSGITCRRATGAKRQGFKVSRQGRTLYR